MDAAIGMRYEFAMPFRERSARSVSQPVATSSTPRTVVVAGDVAIDWLAWPTQPDHSNAHALNWQQLHGTRMVPRAGGAALLARFVEATTGTLPVSYTLPPMETLGPDRYLHSLVDLRAEREPKVPCREQPRRSIGSHIIMMHRTMGETTA